MDQDRVGHGAGGAERCEEGCWKGGCQGKPEELRVTKPQSWWGGRCSRQIAFEFMIFLSLTECCHGKMGFAYDVIYMRIIPKFMYFYRHLIHISLWSADSYLDLVRGIK